MNEMLPGKQGGDDGDGARFDGSFFVGTHPKPKSRKLPPWLDHFNAKDLKVLFKSCLAVWIMTIFIFIDGTLKVLGQSAFFGSIVLFIVPPSGVVLLHVLAGLMIIIGLALGWLWGVITMQAALAARPQADLAAQYRRLQESMSQNTTNVVQASGQATYSQIAIYDGFMLDTRVSVTYYCMMGLFVYLMARLRVITPKLTLTAIFSMVVADIYLTTAPLVPTFQGTIPQVMVIPVAIAVGVGAVCNLLIFPQSTSYIVLDSMTVALAPMATFANALSWHFKNPETRFDPGRLQRLKEELLAAYSSLDSAKTFLPMDFSYGKWSPEDVVSLQEPFRQVFVVFGELLQLSMSREEGRTKKDSLAEAAKALEVKEDSNRRYPIAHHQIAKLVDLYSHSRHPDTDEMITKSMHTLSTTASPLMQAWKGAFDAANEALAGTSKQEHALMLQRHQQAADSLKKALADFEAHAGESLMALHSHLFDEKGNILTAHDSPDHPPPMLGLMVGLLYQERMINFSKASLALLQRITEIEGKRDKSRLWLPKAFQRIFSWGLSRGEATPTASPGNLALQRTATALSRIQSNVEKKSKDDSDKDGDSAAARLQEIRSPTSRQRHRASTVLLGLIRWFTGDEGIFALRTLVVTIAIAIPAVIPSSAGFYYREKGMWALVMAQFALVPYTSDFVFGIIIRTLATVAGGVLGLLCWYIGAGSGPGNAYGLAAVMAVAIIVMMWWRLWAPPEHMPAGIMLTSTMYMVVAYSWVDTHIPSYGNPGVGYNVFWRRVLLVLIGFAASTVVMFFPRPVSGNRHHRQVLSDQISAVKDRYALFISTWSSPPGDFVETIEKEAIASEELLTSLLGPIKLTKFEFTTSNIDTSTLSKARHLCANMNIFITQLLLNVEKLPHALRAQFMRSMGANDEKFLADLMAVLTIVQQSLLSGNSMPAVLPTPLLTRANISRPTRKANGEPDSADNAIYFENQLSKGSGRQWISAINAFVCFLGSVDDLVVAVKMAVGEGHNVDLDVLHAERA